MSRRMDAFWERQLDDKWELRRKLAMLQRDLRVAADRDQDVMLQGAQGAQGFRQMLQERFGTIAAGWRVGLDFDRNGKVSFGELRLLCRQLGFTGNLKKLWAELDPNRSGFIALSVMDPEAAAGLQEFFDFILGLFGSTQEAWRRGLNKKNAPRVPEKDFILRCKELGFQGDAKKVFGWLRTDMARKELTFYDLDPAAASAVDRADPCADAIGAGSSRRLTASPTPIAVLSPMASSRPPGKLSLTASVGSLGGGRTPSPMGSPVGGRAMSPLSMSVGSVSAGMALNSSAVFGRMSPMQQRLRPGSLTDSAVFSRSPSAMTSPSAGMRQGDYTSPTRNSSWIREVSRAQIAELTAIKDAHADADVGMRTAADLRAKLAARFGSTLAGWQLAFDTHGKGAISFVDFADKLRALGYLGDLKILWNDLGVGARSDQLLRLADLDREADEMLTEFRTKLCAKHGTMLKAWTGAFDPKKRGVIERNVFVKECLSCAFRGANSVSDDGGKVSAERLFRMLQDKSDGNDKERRFLTLREFDLRAYRAFKREDHDMITEATGEDRLSPKDSTFHERQERMAGHRWKKAQSTMIIDASRKAREEERRADKCCSNIEDLKKRLERKYGNCATAWRVALDPHDQGQLSKDELAIACRERVGYRGDLNALWSELVRRPQTDDEPISPKAAEQKQTAHITLRELDVDSADLLQEFRDFLLKKYPSLVFAWKGLDSRRSGRLEKEDFVEQCANVGFKVGEGERVARLFDLLRAGPHRTYITLSDIDLRSAQAYYRGDNNAMTVHGPKVKVTEAEKAAGGDAAAEGDEAAECELAGSKSPAMGQTVMAARDTRLAEWSRELGKRKREDVNVQWKQEHDRSFSVKGVEGFRAVLTSRYRTTTAAWRTLLDPELHNRVTFAQFGIAVERMGGLTGKVKALWETMERVTLEVHNGDEIKRKLGYFSLEDLDAEADRELTAFREAWRASGEDVQILSEVWRKGLLGGARVDKETFLKQCLRRLGASTTATAEASTPEQPAQPAPGQPAPGAETQPPSAEAPAEAASPEVREASGWTQRRLLNIFKMLLPEPSSGRHNLIEDDLEVLLVNLPPTEREAYKVKKQPESPRRAPSRNGPLSPSARGPMSPGASSTMRGDASPRAKSPREAFKKILKKNFGSILAGWTRHLDVSEQWRVPRGVFVQKARDIGVPGNLKELFDKFAQTGKEFITLKDLDPEVHQALEDFQTLAKEKCGSFAKMWLKLDIGARGFVTQEEFVEGLTGLGYQGDAAQLFRFLRPEKDRHLLCLEDLGHHGAQEMREIRAQTSTFKFRASSPKSKASQRLGNAGEEAFQIEGSEDDAGEGERA